MLTYGLHIYVVLFWVACGMDATISRISLSQSTNPIAATMRVNQLFLAIPIQIQFAEMKNYFRI